MKNLLENLQKILPTLLKIFEMLGAFGKMLPWLILVAAIGGAGYFIFLNYKDPYKCVDNEIYEQLRVDSDVYVFKGGYCITGQNKND